MVCCTRCFEADLFHWNTVKAQWSTVSMPMNQQHTYCSVTKLITRLDLSSGATVLSSNKIICWIDCTKVTRNSAIHSQTPFRMWNMCGRRVVTRFLHTYNSSSHSLDTEQGRMKKTQVCLSWHLSFRFVLVRPICFYQLGSICLLPIQKGFISLYRTRTSSWHLQNFQLHILDQL